MLGSLRELLDKVLTGLILVVIVMAVAVIAFIVSGIVHWPETLVMAVSSIAGGYVGALGAKRVDQRAIKGFVVVLGVALTVYFFVRGA